MLPSESKLSEHNEEEEPLGLACALENFVEVDEVFEMIENLSKIYSDRSLNEKAYERFLLIIGQYKEQPHLLDKHIDDLLEKCINIVRSEHNPMTFKHAIFKYMFVVVNVRGYKVIVRHLPHEVSDFEAVLRLLESQDCNDAETWTTRYVLLLWLSIIVMIPFDLSRFDDCDSNRKSVMLRVLELIKKYLVLPDKCRDAAAYLSARFITRNDVKDKLGDYFDWTVSVNHSDENNVFSKQGTLASIATILKHGKRNDLLPHIRKILQWITNDDLRCNSGTSVQKLVYKIVQRIGLTFLPPRVAAWRYKRGCRSLAANLSGGDGTLSQEVSLDESEDEKSVVVPDEVEEVIDQLIQGLRSGDGVVRWSAAKGVGRVTGRLPQDLADDVVASVLELFSPREGDGAWHGGCLSLAELGRRGLLLPRRLPEVVPVVLKALVYDEPRGYSSVGSHIRDAACFVCWAFARAYDKDILRPFVPKLAATLVVVTCYDREINCRRAASAAFQENVGRQGTFPHGIDILTVADFFNVSARNNSYLAVSPYIAQFEEYTVPLIEHLLTRKVDHWDVAVRELTADTLHKLTPKAPDYMQAKALPVLFEKIKGIDLNGRHGAVLAIGEIVNALKELGKTLTGEVLQELEEMVPRFRNKLYFRGLGGELMRSACCHFIQNCSLAAVVFDNTQTTDDWLQLLDECIAYNVPSIQSAAIAALPVLLVQYYSLEEARDKRKELVKKYIHELKSTTLQEIRMGHALALGSLPKLILQSDLIVVLEALVDASRITHATAKWAESRRDSIKALTKLCTTMSEEMGAGFPNERIKAIFHVFLASLKDYTQDKRGDVGAWVREASMLGLEALTNKVNENNATLLDTELMRQIMGGIAQQAVERIDRTRALAGRIFYNFLSKNIPNIPNYADVLGIFGPDCESMNWNSAVDTFPLFVELLRFDAYSYYVMLGMIFSVGGLTETLVKNSSGALFAYLEELKRSQRLEEINRLCAVILQIFTDHQRNDRIAVPMLRFLEKLFGSGCIQHLIEEDTTIAFCTNILKLVMGEVQGCRDVYKLVDGINILAQFVQMQGEVCERALVQMSILLCHRQAYIRKSTASIFYEALLVHGDGVALIAGNLDEVMQVLSCTNWEEPVEKVKPVRNRLCQLMGIRVPVAKPVKK